MSCEQREQNPISFDLSPATIRDIDTVVFFIEEAKRGSIGEGFSDWEKGRTTEIYTGYLNDPEKDILLIRESSQTPSGLVSVEYDTPQDPFIIHTDPFIDTKVLGSNDPLPIDEITGILTNRTPERIRAHIVAIAIDESRRHQGLGKQVIDALPSKLKRPADMISFNTGKNNIPMIKAAKGFTFVELSNPDIGYTTSLLAGFKKTRR